MEDYDNMLDFVSESTTCQSVTFSGCYDMNFSVFLKLFKYYKETGINLLDTYSAVKYMTWDKDSNEVYDKEKYDIIIEAISNPIIQELFNHSVLNQIYLDITAGYESYCNIVSKKPKQERSKACSYTAKLRIKELVYKLHGKSCLCCGTDKNLSLDHIIPIHKGGKNEIDNLQPLCKPCNSKKGINTTDYRKG